MRPNWYETRLGDSLLRDAELRASPENPKYSLSDPRIVDMLMGDDATTHVTPGNSLQSSAVFACVRVLSEALAQLPINLYRKTPDGRRERITDHWAAELLRSGPNPIMSRVTFFEQQQMQLALWGNCYAQRVFDRRTDETIGLYPLSSSEVTPIVTQTTDDRGYPTLRKQYRVKGQTLGQEDILHIPLVSLDGVTGLSPIALNRMGVGLSMAQAKFASKFYENGTRLSGVLKHPNKLGPEAGGRLRENWSQVYQGANNAGKVAILEEGMTFESLSMPLEDAQFIETVKFNREQIASIFRVPQHMIGNLDRATFSNIEHQSLEFAVYTLGPYLVKYEQALQSLLSPREQVDHYWKYNLDALLRGDIKSRYEAYAVARNWGWMSANDILDLEDRNPIDKGDVYLQPMNMVPAGTPPDPKPAAQGATNGS